MNKRVKILFGITSVMICLQIALAKGIAWKVSWGLVYVLLCVEITSKKKRDQLVLLIGIMIMAILLIYKKIQGY